MAKSLRKTTLSCAVATAVHLAIFPAAALAQGTDSADSLRLDEIIVTAQRREQNVQDIPLSVTALSADSLRAAGVVDLSRLKLLVPGMNFGQTGVYSHIAVRGARSEGVQVNSQPVFSYYNDGIYRSGVEQFLGLMVDVDRVEVLRGPQGTLFGRNSYGGAIAVHTKNPEQEFDASIKYTTGDYSQSDIEAMINFPLGDTVSARIVAAHFEHDGYVKNIYPDGVGGDGVGNVGVDTNDQDADYIRGALLFEFDNASLILRGELYEQGGAGTGDFQNSTVGSLDPTCWGPCSGGDVFGVPQPFNTLSSCLTFYGSALAYDAQGLCPQSDTTDPYTINVNGPYILDAKQETFSATLDMDFGWSNMTLLVAATDNEDLHQGDGDVADGDIYISGEYVTRDTTQVEVHFTDNGEGDVSWLVGAFYLDESSHWNFFFSNSYASGTHYTFMCAPDLDVQAESTAVFGEVTFPVSDSTRITVGGRYSHEEYDWAINSYFAYAGTEPWTADFLSLGIHDRSGVVFTAPDTLLTDTFEPLTWRLAVDHSLSEDSMIYGSVATGYSSGGFNAVADPHNGRFTYDDMNNIAYEVGYKATLKDGAMTLNIAAFYNDYKDYIAEPAVVLAPSVLVYQRNGGDAEAIGIDLEMDWIPAEGWLLNLRASVLNAEYGNFVTGLGGTLDEAGDQLEFFEAVETPNFAAGDLVPEIRLDGKQIAFSPDFTLGLTVSKTMNLGGGGTLTPLLQFYYSDSYSASDQGYSWGQQDAYSQSSFRLTWASGEGRFNISAFVNNIEDEAVINRANIFGSSQATRQIAPPRTWGVSFGYNHR